jgi:hypothetical protein
MAETSVVTIKDSKFGEIKYYLEKRLKYIIDKKIVPSLQQKDKDFFMVVDGSEGTGKSWLSLQIAKYVDSSFNLSRVVFTPDEFKDAIFKAKKGQAVVYDEAFTGLSSRASLSMVNKILISLAMQMRQKNLFVIIVLPSFFLLDKYIALFRSRCLVHVYENKNVRGYFKIYNQKKKILLYLAGKATYSYSKKIRTRFKGRFYGNFALGDEKEEEKYRLKKKKALEATEKNPITAGQVKYREQRDLFLYLLRKNTKLTYQELENLLGDYDLDLSYVQIRNICARFGDKETKDEKDKSKSVETDGESTENEDFNEIVEENEDIFEESDGFDGEN